MNRPHGVYSPLKHRYALAADKIPDSCRQVLDVGGYRSRASLVASFRPGIQYASINLGSAWYSDEVCDVRYDGHGVPVADNCVDAVISVDTLEHLASGQRLGLLNEAVRIARQVAVIVTPFQTLERTPDEHYFLELARHFNIAPMPSLVEHERFGLPELTFLKEAARELGGVIYPATPRAIYWSSQFAMLWNTIAEVKDEPANKRIQERIEEFLSVASTPQDFHECYRAVLVFKRRSQKSA